MSLFPNPGRSCRCCCNLNFKYDTIRVRRAEDKSAVKEQMREAADDAEEESK